MLKIGCHVSFKKEEQLLGSVKEALSYNANTFMIYTGAPQNTNRIPIDNTLSLKGIDLIEKNNIDINDIVVHAPYIVNLANANLRDFSINFLKQELKRCKQLNINKLVLHPGSHVGIGIENGINNIVSALDEVLEDSNVYILLETMAGKGTEIGSKIDELKVIIDKCKYKSKLMLCLDSCHLHDAGYDISNFNVILDEIDEKIGISKIGCIHINDSKNQINDKKDRHANLGFGNLGFDNIINIIYNERLKKVPKILETPYIEDNPPYKFEIEMIKNKKKYDDLIEKTINYYKKS